MTSPRTMMQKKQRVSWLPPCTPRPRPHMQQGGEPGCACQPSARQADRTGLRHRPRSQAMLLQLQRHTMMK